MKQIQAFETTDGCIFVNQVQAAAHEKNLERRKIIIEILRTSDVECGLDESGFSSVATIILENWERLE